MGFNYKLLILFLFSSRLLTIYWQYTHAPPQVVAFVDNLLTPTLPRTVLSWHSPLTFDLKANHEQYPKFYTNVIISPWYTDVKRFTQKNSVQRQKGPVQKTANSFVIRHSIRSLKKKVSTLLNVHDKYRSSVMLCFLSRPFVVASVSKYGCLILTY